MIFIYLVIMGRFDIHKDISLSHTLPTNFYTDPKIFEKSKDRVFARSWQFVGGSDLLKDQTTVYPFDLLAGYLDEPLVLTRSKGDKILCMSNVCTHRGNLVVDNPGNQEKLICGYHGRKFKLDGTFETMPEFGQTKDFPSDCDSLTRVPLFKWRQFLFVCLDPLFKFDSMAQAMDEKVGYLPIEDFVFVSKLSRDYLVKAHWALYCDNYLEGFHIPFVHHQLHQVLDYNAYETILKQHCNVQIGYATSGTETFAFPPDHSDKGKEIGAYYFWLFPNLLFNFYPWGLSINVVTPLKMDLCKVSFYIYMHDESKIDQSAGALLDKVEKEDEGIVENVQKGISSRFYKKGRFSPTREQGVHHFHQLLSEFLID